MGDPITPINPEVLNPTEKPSTPEVVPVLEPLPTPESFTPQAEAIQPNTVPTPTLQNIEPLPSPVQEAITIPIPVVEKAIPLEALPPESDIKKEEPKVISEVPIVQVKRNKKKIIIFFFIVFLVLTAAITAFLVLSRKDTTVENTVIENEDDLVSHPAGTYIRTFEGKLYNISFKYTSDLGKATSKTSKLSYPDNTGDCKIENIAFNGDPNISINVSTGHCEGGSAPTSAYSKITSKDGKSFFMIVKSLDVTLFPGLYTITVSGGVDSSDSYVAGLTGVHIDAIRVKDVEKYKKYILDIISSMTIELTPLKSNNFDIESNI